eukprot:c23498_g1_i7 orf=83-280(+)
MWRRSTTTTPTESQPSDLPPIFGLGKKLHESCLFRKARRGFQEEEGGLLPHSARGGFYPTVHGIG